jgi:nicotinic acid mononucleotide adenylyltransferase
LAQLATSDSDWIDVLPWGWANARTIMQEATKILNQRLAPVRPRLFLVVGSDHAFRHELYRKPGSDVICIHRNQDGETLKKAMESGPLNPNFILVDGEPVDISSTKVRNLLKIKDWSALEEILHPLVVEHLKSIST